jgi:hypothetical protein
VSPFDSQFEGALYDVWRELFSRKQGVELHDEGMFKVSTRQVLVRPVNVIELLILPDVTCGQFKDELVY